MFDFFKSGLSSLTIATKEISAVCVAVAVITYLVIFLIELFIKIFLKVKRKTVYFLCYSLINSLFTAYFCIEDFFNQKLLFETPKSVYLFITLLIGLAIAFYSLLNALSTQSKAVREEIKPCEDKICEEFKVETINSSGLQNFKNGGYLDVVYLKSLISKLKEKELSNSDYDEVEDLELYLLNFVNRQPEPEERTILSEKISMLIKKIAFYLS